MAHLRQLERTFFTDQRKGDQFGYHFWNESKRVADECGPRLVHAAMRYIQLRKWYGEEPLILVPALALLERRATVRVLQQYQRSENEIEGLETREILIEFDMDDTKDAVRRYCRGK